MTPTKITRILSLISIVLFLSFTARSQNVAGVWAGKLYQDAGGLSLAPTEYLYVLKVEQNGNTALGQAYIQSASGATKYTGEFDISLTVFSNAVLYKDLAVTESTLPAGSWWCIKEGRLNYDMQKNRIYGEVRGYSSASGITTNCARIFLDLYRTEPSKSERPTPKRANNSWAGNGTGVVIDPKGIIATNYHVVEEASEIEVDFGIGDGKKSYKCDVLVTDKKNDLAILRINDRRFVGFGTLPYTFKTTVAKVGESVFSLGYPKALSILGTEIKFTRGDISALSGAEGDPTTYTLSLSIQPGNSGGPLFDLNGNLIGITNAKIISPDVENVSYAIKSIYLKSFIDLSSYRINLPTGSSLAGKPITDQVAVLSDYVGLVKIR